MAPSPESRYIRSTADWSDLSVISHLGVQLKETAGITCATFNNIDSIITRDMMARAGPAKLRGRVPDMGLDWAGPSRRAALSHRGEN